MVFLLLLPAAILLAPVLMLFTIALVWTDGVPVRSRSEDRSHNRAAIAADLAPMEP